MTESEVQLKQRIDTLRARAVAGELTEEECAEAFAALRAGRTAAIVTRTKTKATKAPPDAGALLDQVLGQQ